MIESSEIILLFNFIILFFPSSLVALSAELARTGLKLLRACVYFWIYLFEFDLKFMSQLWGCILSASCTQQLVENEIRWLKRRRWRSDEPAKMRKKRVDEEWISEKTFYDYHRTMPDVIIIQTQRRESAQLLLLVLSESPAGHIRCWLLLKDDDDE